MSETLKPVIEFPATDDANKVLAAHELFSDRKACLEVIKANEKTAKLYRRVWVNAIPQGIWFVGKGSKADGRVREALGIHQRQDKSFADADGNDVTCVVLNLPAQDKPYNVSLPAEIMADLEADDETTE